MEPRDQAAAWRDLLQSNMYPLDLKVNTVLRDYDAYRRLAALGPHMEAAAAIVAVMEDFLKRTGNHSVGINWAKEGF